MRKTNYCEKDEEIPARKILRDLKPGDSYVFDLSIDKSVKRRSIVSMSYELNLDEDKKLKTKYDKRNKTITVTYELS